MLERDVVPEPRAQPAGEQVGLRLGARSPRSSSRPRSPARATRAAGASGSSGPRRCRRPPPGRRSRPARVGRRQVRPLGRVDDQPVDHVDQLLERPLAERRQPAPAQEDGQVGQQQRLHDARGHLGARAVEPDADRLDADLAALAQRVGARPRRSPRCPSSASGSGTSTIVREGWRSARPASTSSAASTHCVGTQAMCVITLVRWIGSPVCGSTRRRASSRSISEIVPSAVATCDRLASSARPRPRGPQVPAA